jgi:2-polyprenyl-6-methoxyphenol hydroxylase-like FAD-dependent oxidoreductase
MTSVLISGAGIGGPTLAYWLNAAGFEPTLVERSPNLRTGGYVIDFWGLGYDIAGRMGLLDKINRAGYHIREMRIVDDRGRRIAGFGTSVFSEVTSGRYVTIGRSDLSRLLFETIENDTEIIFGDEIVGLQNGPGAVQVSFKSGRQRSFDLVVGADGLHSAVRRLVFGAQDRFEKQLGYVVAAFEATGYRPREENVYTMYSQPGRMLGRVALKDDRTLFLFVFAADSAKREMTEVSEQKAALREAYAGGLWETPRILAELERTRNLYFDRVSQIKMPAWSQGRVALLGDAAFCVSLMAGQGTALAMTAAYVLAGELGKAGHRHQLAFRNYENILRDFIETKQNGAARFASAFAPRTHWGLFLRNQVAKVFAIPGIARFSIGRDIVDNLELPDYAWNRPAAAAPRPALSASH